MFWTTKLRVLKKLVPRKLSWKLTLIYAALFSAVLILLNAGTLFGIRYYMSNQAKSQVRSSTANTLNFIQTSKGTIHLSDSKYLSEAATVPEIDIVISDTSGQQISSSETSSDPVFDSQAGIGQIRSVETDNRHFMIENSKISAANGRFIGFLQVTYEMDSEYRFIRLLFIFLAFADALGIAFSLLAGLILSRRALKPIDSMIRTARQISGNDLSRRVEVGAADDELSRLAVTFNEMLERLQKSFEKESRFVSDASHELRTPIAIIKGYADLLAQWAKNDPQVLDESVSAIRSEANEMTRLTEQLLFLARGDSGKLKLQKEDFPAAGLLREIIEESSLIAPKHNFIYQAPEALMLHADRKLLKQVLRALVDNAVKYTPENGSIELDALTNEKGILLRVTDTGIGIPAKEQPKLFDRFYRVDKDRSKEKGGSGLGLSIVKWIVDAHEGSVTVKSEKGKGTSFTIRLPK